MQYIKQVSLMDDTPQDGAYYLTLPAVQGLRKQNKLSLQAPVTFLVGENGSGKSTLLEAVAVAAGFNAEGGTRNFHFATHESHSGLYEHIQLVRSAMREKDGFFLRAESYYNAASYIQELDAIAAYSPRIIDSYGGKSLHEQSHGESFLSLCLHRLGGNGLYIFDEPEAALSPQNQLTLLARIHQLVGQDSQFIIATHSPILMAYPGARIYQLDGDIIQQVAYDDVEHVQLTRHIMGNTQKFMQQLLQENE